MLFFFFFFFVLDTLRFKYMSKTRHASKLCLVQNGIEHKLHPKKNFHCLAFSILPNIQKCIFTLKEMESINAKKFESIPNYKNRIFKI